VPRERPLGDGRVGLSLGDPQPIGVAANDSHLGLVVDAEEPSSQQGDRPVTENKRTRGLGRVEALNEMADDRQRFGHHGVDGVNMVRHEVELLGEGQEMGRKPARQLEAHFDRWRGPGQDVLAHHAPTEEVGVAR
jgi:hypothetical protein